MDAAAYLGFRPHTLETWRSRGEAPPYLRLQRSVRYELRALDEWVDANAEPGELVEVA